MFTQQRGSGSGWVEHYCTISRFIVCLQITACIADDGVVFTRQRGSGSEWVEHYCISVPLVDPLSVYRLQPALLMMGLCLHERVVRLWVGGTLLYYCTISWSIVCLQITACMADDGVVFTRQRGSGSEWVEHYCTISWSIVCLQITACIADDGVVFTRQRGSGSEWVEHYCIDFNPGFKDLPSQQTEAVSFFF